MNAFVPVTFREDTVWAVDQAGTVFVAIKPMCANLTLDWSSQHKRIERDAVLSKGMVIMTIPSPGGDQETTCLPLNLVPGFLFGIDDRRIADPAVREKVLAYKLECYDVLFRHFFGGSAAPVADDLSALPALPDPFGAFRRMDPIGIAWVNAAAGLLARAGRARGRAATEALWPLLGLPEVRAPEALPDVPIELGDLMALDLGRHSLAEAWRMGLDSELKANRMRRMADGRDGLWIDTEAPVPLAVFGRGWHRRLAGAVSLVAKFQSTARRGVFIPSALVNPAVAVEG